MSETTSAKKKSPLWLWIIAAVVLMLCLFLIYKTAQANEDLDAKSNELMEYVDAIDAANKKTHEMEEEIRTFLEGYDDVLQVHGLLVDTDRKDINADVVIDYAALRRQMVYDEIEMRLKEKYPEYRVYITRDAS